MTKATFLRLEDGTLTIFADGEVHIVTKQGIKKAAAKPLAVKQFANPVGFRHDVLRFEATTIRGTASQPQRVKNKWGKIKTKLEVLAKGTQTYSCGKPEVIVSDAKLFNLLTEKRIDKRWVYTQHVDPIKHTDRFKLIAPEVPANIMVRVGDLLTALLAFRGKTLEVVSRELKLAKQKGDKSLTYNINTLVTWGEVCFPVGHVTVKKTFADGIFFSTDTCKRVAKLISGAKATYRGEVNQES